MPLFELHRILQAYAGRTVLTIDAWQVPEGKIVGLCGPNGSGKSTLLRLLGFVERPVRGTIHYQGRPAEPYADAVRGRVVLLPQASYMLRRTVYKNVAYGLRIGRVRCDIRQRVGESLGLVGLDPDAFAQRPWFALSGGEARRVALAARLVLRPRVLLLDEPTASVDSASAQMIQAAALHAHRQWGTCLIVTSHDHHWLQDTCDETVHLFQGRILGRGDFTLVFGPWQPGENRRLAAPLGRDQWLTLDPPPAGAAESDIAALDARHLTLHALTDPLPPGTAVVEGTITALALGKTSGQISVSLTVGATPFTAYLPPEMAATGHFTPGNKARLAYSPDAVRWV
ncbi:ABC transporter ATP-binding protein [Desulfatitalea alkaliphila]|uniref:Energy-coupling factor ABC transporter ATP-binding protein n=1 Tax=Desulfatitalea alkaliphila TaxID=2929485 RepID=A0AA41UIA4_9BACT|nr:ABC transporter ATP-binding protein [Desulfatitalea alkaliphila]MCJ8499407.1 energy-coupling factor ABC transporter ATP-binding protein [Desulfatitalea alkaliphila]